MRPEPTLFATLVLSRPAPLLRHLRRGFVMVLVATGYLAIIGALLLLQLLVVESMPPPKAVTGPVIIFHPPPRDAASSGGERRGGPARPTGPAAVTAAPPTLQPPAPLPMVVPLAPPADMRTSEARTVPDTGVDPAGPAGGGGGPDDSEAIGPAGPGGGGCPTCPPGETGPGPGPGVYPDDTPGIIPPVVIPSTRALPKYPDLARRAFVQGSVILLIVIDADGRVGEIQVLSSPDPRFGFDLAAIEAVKQWRYRPAMLGRRRVAVQASVMVEFSLSR
ncbi:MAG TPA: energy transducer TonB [Patescibacteria group bacterium]|nr:energy transducer TonB [Patescibacteria group bacterium]